MSLWTVIGQVAEHRIQEAIEQGQFEDLPGQGEPLELEDDSMVPEELKMAYKLLKNAGYTPRDLPGDGCPAKVADLMEPGTQERRKVRRMNKLEVMLSRIGVQRGQDVKVEEYPEYLDRLVDRVPLAPEAPPHKG